MYGLQTNVIAGVIGLVLGSIIAFVVTSADKDRTIQALKDVIKTDRKTIDNLYVVIETWKKIANNNNGNQLTLSVSLYDPTTGDLARSETFKDLVTGFAFIKQNRVWDQHVSIVRANQTRVTVVIEAR